MRVLVTGASGFLGRHLVSALRTRGDFVVALIRDFVPSPFKSDLPSAAVYGGLDQVERSIAEYEVDTVIHLAAQTQVSVAVADAFETFGSNTMGTVRVLDACRRQNVRVVIASSDKVYGDGPVPYVEDQPLLPNGVYATSKACADFVAQSYVREYGMSVAVTRCGNLFGPGHTNWSTLIPGTIRSVLKGERPRLRSDGGPLRDFLYVEDAVDGYLRLANTQHVGAFNFGTARGVSVRRVVDTILKVMGSDLVPIIDVPTTDAPVEIREQILSHAKATQMLDWSPQHTLEAGISKTVEWYRLHLEALG